MDYTESAGTLNTVTLAAVVVGVSGASTVCVWEKCTLERSALDFGSVTVVP